MKRPTDLAEKFLALFAASEYLSLRIRKNKFQFLMIIDIIKEHFTIWKQMQSLGTKHVLEHAEILTHFTDLNQWYFSSIYTI